MSLENVNIGRTVLFGPNNITGNSCYNNNYRAPKVNSNLSPVLIQYGNIWDSNKFSSKSDKINNFSLGSVQNI